MIFLADPTDLSCQNFKKICNFVKSANRNALLQEPQRTGRAIAVDLIVAIKIIFSFVRFDNNRVVYRHFLYKITYFIF